MSSKRWYTVEILYDSDNEVRKFQIRNLDAVKLKEFREAVFIAGAYRRIDEDTGEVISPFRIRSVIVCKQAYFFGPADLQKPIKKDK